jgi:Chorismate synthase
MDRIKLFLKLRKEEENFTKPEEDRPEIISGVSGGTTSDIPVTVFFKSRGSDQTLPLVFFGAAASSYLEKRGISVASHVKSVGETYDEPLPQKIDSLLIDRLNSSPFPTVSPEARKKMISLLTSLKAVGESIGGRVETAVLGIPFFSENLKCRIAGMLFSLPEIREVGFEKGYPVIIDTATYPSASPIACNAPRMSVAVTSAVAIALLDAYLDSKIEK